MKKTILALAIIMVFAASSFASVSFLTAPGLGAGKFDLLGVYATSHMGSIANNDIDPQVMDLTSLGIKGGYGIMDGVDLLLGYSADSAVNLKSSDIDGTQTSGNTVGIGVKYTLPKSVNMLPVDVAVLVGYEQSALGYTPALGPKVSESLTSYALGVILSKEIGICVPYGGIAVKSLTQDVGKAYGTTIDPIGGTGLALNLGVYVGIAANQAVAIEYNTENDAWKKVTKSGTTLADESATSVSGISLGYVYMF
jgi:hypothetical protein